MDAKQACDKLNGFNFQNRYLVGTSASTIEAAMSNYYCALSITIMNIDTNRDPVLYHQPEKMAKSKEDLAERQENLEKLKRQHGIE